MQVPKAADAVFAVKRTSEGVAGARVDKGNHSEYGPLAHTLPDILRRSLLDGLAEEIVGETSTNGVVTCGHG